MKKILIIGATSAIARELAKRFAGRGDKLFLLGRDEGKLQIIHADLQIRGAAKVVYAAADLANTEKHAGLLQQVYKTLGEPDVVLLAYGTLGEQAQCEQDYTMAQQEFQTNFISPVSWLTLLANDFARRGSGSIVVLSSVAGDRGRQSNYIYGAAKGGLSIFVQGLRNRLYHSGVHVLTVKPGFTDTPMTADMKKNFLFVSPAKVARDIEQALEKRQTILYTPWFWRFIMLVIKLIPEWLFIKLKL
ncbi:SDR family oxidoreductase [Candidatus Venteria ishoeyi]|uniref:Putative ketoacyl reductase n=1 Tax=Candidatus Venteria ishoeyi TaxID=1899563 RepID=A0A1H6FDN8_9GAMM|nr:SDR family oxidoreductase [Candidatus Venteria ishoeyi]SEH07144.1 Putative ketoacyl reductase [Candidatus Venteria ishoeyi]